MRFTRASTTAPARPALRVDRVDGARSGRAFTDSFCVGRDAACDLVVDSGLASRRHLEFVVEGDRWIVRDLDSTNGTYLDGDRISSAPLNGTHAVRLGADGPVIDIHVESEEGAGAIRTQPALTQSARTEPARTSPGVKPSNEPAAPTEDELSVTGYVAKYFSDEDLAAGDQTRMIRQAYQRVSRRNRRVYVRLLAAAGALVVLAFVYAGVQHWRAARLENRALEAFRTMKQLDVQTARLQLYIEERGDAALSEQLAELASLRQRTRARYEGYVEELGLRRRLNEEEREIYRVARIFNESEFEMPAMFVRAVRETIRTYWLTPGGRGRFASAVARAEREGDAARIVETMMRYGLPPEFFYLALQESNFDPTVSGPRTRWGIAKGMWQFIPETGQAYGLVIGPREAQRVFDPLDERHDPALATDAAARYLLEIYSQLAQASGLLAMASYNWGERRVVPRLQELLEGIPDEPEARSYWRFLTEYSARMPEETKDYVLKIFSAAVIGQNPRLFGFDFDNPLQRYIESTSAHGGDG